MNGTNRFWLPTIIAVAVIIGILIGMRLTTKNENSSLFSIGSNTTKFEEILHFVSSNYVDSINVTKVSDQSYVDLLKQLDPHSSYIPASELQGVNEVLEGNFEGVGIEFYVVNDTIMVLNAIPGGPSQTVGIQSADKIIKIQDTLVAGVKITTEQIVKKLRGKKDSKVTVSIKRGSKKELINFTITRGEIPMNSVDAAFMLDKETGYIKVNRFAQDTYQEFMRSLDDLINKQGMKSLVIDLRQNGGGYLESATKILDEFLSDNRLLLYTEGRSRRRFEYNCKKDGMFETGNMAILVDEGSASASEITAGALQDWDRAVIVGRRSFGKGLVQEQYELGDGSAIRLTVARYYTPSGRCIQKDYKSGVDAYELDLMNRYKHGEFLSSDSIRYADTVNYRTASGRIVHGGGGIKPDIFVPLDTSNSNAFINSVFSKGLVAQFAYQYFADHKTEIAQYPSIVAFEKGFSISDKTYMDFVNYANKHGVAASSNRFAANSATFLKFEIRAYIARQQWKMNGFYYLINKEDKAVQKALSVIKLSPAKIKTN